MGLMADNNEEGPFTVFDLSRGLRESVEPHNTAQKLQAIVGHDCVVKTCTPDDWSVSVTVNETDTLELSYWPTMEEDDWSTGQHQVIERPSARPYRVDSPRYTRGKTFASLDSARKALLHEAMAICLRGTPTPAAGPSGEAK